MASQKPPSNPSNGLVGVTVDHAVYRSFSQFAQTEAWSPAVNIYQADKCLHVCVDLAGIERDQIDVRIEPGRLSVSGVRHSPEPKPKDKPAKGRGGKPGGKSGDLSGGDMKVHSLEIDYGSFCRIIQVPREVDLDGVQSEYRRGILWITLPLR